MLGSPLTAPGTPYVAPLSVPAAAGTVTLAEHDLFYTGGTVIIDHGYGLATTYQHMDSVDVMVKAAKDAQEGLIEITGKGDGVKPGVMRIRPTVR